MVLAGVEYPLDDGEDERPIDYANDAIRVYAEYDAEVGEDAGDADLRVCPIEDLVADEIVQHHEADQQEVVAVVFYQVAGYGD